SSTVAARRTSPPSASLTLAADRTAQGAPKSAALVCEKPPVPTGMMGGTGVFVAVAVGGTGVLVGGTGVLVAVAVAVGGTAVLVAVAVSVGVEVDVGVLVGAPTGAFWSVTLRTSGEASGFVVLR